MIKAVFGKVMWVGRATVFTVGLAVTVALVFGAASMALGANGGNFILGQFNSATALTRLTGNVQGAAMQVQNTNAGTDDAALALSVQPGEAPMRVNSTGRVVNLNSDRLDGNTAEDFYYYGEKVNDSDSLDGKDSTDFLSSSIYPRQAYRTGNVGTVNFLLASCDPGDLALSAGYSSSEDTTTDTIYTFSRGDGAVSGTQESWDFRWYDRAPATPYILTVYCVDTASP